mgnify:CR=1 FL=1
MASRQGTDGKPPVTVNIAKLQAMNMTELNGMAKQMGIENFGTMRKHEVIFHILQKNAERSGILFSEGVLEVLPEGFGFLRSQSFNYLSCPEDIYVSTGAQMVELVEKNDWAAARKLYAWLLPLMQVNFVESNPIPVKAAMAANRTTGNMKAMRRPTRAKLIASPRCHSRRRPPNGPVFSGRGDRASSSECPV